MIIQFNTDKTIEGSERHSSFFTSFVAEKLERYSSKITRVEIHLSDENGHKSGIDDIRCMMEVRIEGRQPMVVTHKAGTDEHAISGAVEKMKNYLHKVFDQLIKH